MVKKLSCPHCGKYIPADSIYCPKCACSILKEEPENTTTSTVMEESIVFEEKLSSVVSNLVENMAVSENFKKEMEPEPVIVEKNILADDIDKYAANVSTIDENKEVEPIAKIVTKKQLSDVNEKYVSPTINLKEIEPESSEEESISNKSAKEMLEQASKITNPVKISSKGNIVINNTEILDSSEGLTREMVLHGISSIAGIILIIVLLVIVLK